MCVDVCAFVEGVCVRVTKCAGNALLSHVESRTLPFNLNTENERASERKRDIEKVREKERER